MINDPKAHEPATLDFHQDLTESSIQSRREIAQRIIQVHRLNFDQNGLWERLKHLQIALAAAQSESDLLRDKLHLLQNSTFWRLTSPLRIFIAKLRSWRRSVEPSRAPPTASIMTDHAHYLEWIQRGEATCRAAIIPAHIGFYPKTVGVVVWATQACRHVLQSLVADCPSACTVLILDQGANVPTSITTYSNVLHIHVPPAAHPAEAVGLALANLDVDMLCFLDARDRVDAGAMELMASAMAQPVRVDLAFSDEDWLNDVGGRENPFFKPGWDAELQRGRDLVGPFAFFRRDLVERATPVSGAAWHYNLTNQVVAMADPQCILHVPAVLCHRTVARAEPAAMREAIAAQLAHDGIKAQVELHPAEPEWHRIVYTLPDPAPLVSIIVPTRDRHNLLRVCSHGVLHRTRYPSLELIIVDNGSSEPAALDLLNELGTDPRVKIVRAPGAFNWSTLNNLACLQAKGDVLVLLNNDISVEHDDWLTVLVSHAIQPGVGAVGAKLLYPDGRVQHAGLSTDGSGVPVHLFRHLEGTSHGAFGMAALAREVWGVTGACLAIPRTVLQDIGGLNEAFPIAYNDVELCLRLAAHGYRIIWTPWARLVHHEMATRPPDDVGKRFQQVLTEREWLRRDWGTLMLRDPFLNPNLHLIQEQPQFRR